MCSCCVSWDSDANSLRVGNKNSHFNLRSQTFSASTGAFRLERLEEAKINPWELAKDEDVEEKLIQPGLYLVADLDDGTGSNFIVLKRRALNISSFLACYDGEFDTPFNRAVLKRQDNDYVRLLEKIRNLSVDQAGVVHCECQKGDSGGTWVQASYNLDEHSRLQTNTIDVA
jgi:hypothetical protein